MIRFAAACYFGVLRPEIALVLTEASIWGERTGIVVDVNSGADRNHTAGTLHPWDLAVDLDTVGDKPAELALLYAYLVRVLPPPYDVVLEVDHVHVEWDSRRTKPASATGFRQVAPV